FLYAVAPFFIRIEYCADIASHCARASRVRHCRQNFYEDIGCGTQHGDEDQDIKPPLRAARLHGMNSKPYGDHEVQKTCGRHQNAPANIRNARIVSEELSLGQGHEPKLFILKIRRSS